MSLRPLRLAWAIEQVPKHPNLVLKNHKQTNKQFLKSILDQEACVFDLRNGETERIAVSLRLAWATR